MNLLHKVLAEKYGTARTDPVTPQRHSLAPQQYLARSTTSRMPRERVSGRSRFGKMWGLWSTEQLAGRSRRAAIELCRQAVDTDSDAGGAMNDLVALANPPAADGTSGVRLEFEGSESAKKRARAETDALLARLHLPLHELINHELREVYVAGATSLEWYPNRGRSRVEGVELLPPEDITVRRVDDQRQYWQDGNDQAMHPATYLYAAYGTAGRDELGRPAMLAALGELERKAQLTEGIDKAIRLISQGVFLKIGVPKPTPQELGVASESDPGYIDALAGYYESYVETAASARDLGILAVEDGTETQAVNLTGNVGGMGDLEAMNALKVWSGLMTLPFMRGKMDSTTQALAQIVYPILLTHANNMREPVRRSVEFGLNLNLRLAGIPARVRLQFAEPANPFIEAHAKAAQLQAETDTLYTELYGEPYLRWAAERDGFDPEQVLAARQRAPTAANSPPGGTQ
ncbi:hypothetical protein [Deinococcus radiophilus]|uniref:Phage portal protein n=1 Tax=Deinococcus radiophilus TaxID=32062 RepID=A0A3S0KL22_9DEIO|nr:hypothetical protein [Deinococcus radiophilus]RTR29055.1 hypothetical protein EJ104_04215 [Deinococcus radiophilus]